MVEQQQRSQNLVHRFLKRTLGRTEFAMQCKPANKNLQPKSCNLLKDKYSCRLNLSITVPKFEKQDHFTIFYLFQLLPGHFLQGISVILYLNNEMVEAD